MWPAVTSLGDSALLLPLIAWMALSLLIPRHDRTQGFRWVVAAGACGGVVALSKLLFMGWGVGAGLPGLDYTGFSGHTALSTLVWPSIAGVLTRRANSAVRFSMLVLGLLIALGVAISRLVLRDHSVSEVILGAAWGLLTAAWFLQSFLRHARQSETVPLAIAARRQLLLVGGGFLIAIFCYGRVFPSQYMLRDLAVWLSGRPNAFNRQAQLP